MESRSSLGRRFLFLRLLRWGFVTGATYDFLFAAALLFAPELLERATGVPTPEPRFYLPLTAVFLCILGAVYLLVASDPRRYFGVLLTAIAGRTAGFVVLLVASLSGPELAGLLPCALVDLAFALWHGATVRPALAAGSIASRA